MRYSLRILLGIVAAIAVALGAIKSLGIALLVPHAIVVSCLVWLVRRAQWRYTAWTIAVYLGAWLVTASVGVPIVREQVRTRLLAVHPRELGGLRHLDYDPMVDETRNWIAPPWIFVGNATAPCPFVVTVDYGMLSAPLLGDGGRAYFIWIPIPGYEFHIETEWSWIS
jgi:hypothetical protein